MNKFHFSKLSYYLITSFIILGILPINHYQLGQNNASESSEIEDPIIYQSSLSDYLNSPESGTSITENIPETREQGLEILERSNVSSSIASIENDKRGVSSGSGGLKATADKANLQAKQNAEGVRMGIDAAKAKAQQKLQEDQLFQHDRHKAVDIAKEHAMSQQVKPEGETE